MEKSDSITELAKSLVKFQEQMPAVTLDRVVSVSMKSGGKYSFSYATFKNIKEVSTPILAKNGLSIAQPLESDGSVTTMLMHESGEYISSNLLIKPASASPQELGSAITYNKRYSYAAILGIVADDDDDANIAEGNNYETAPIVKWLNPNTEQWAKSVAWLQGEGKTIQGLIAFLKSNNMAISKSNQDKIVRDAQSSM